MPPRASHGFTLIELAIVLVLIGLVAGGVLGGMTIIKNQRLQSVMAELDSNIKAVKLFQEKYTALPGDMPSANAVWSTATNGDGNGLIVSDYTANPDEMYQAWYQLSLAELVPGQYSGTGASWAVTPATNVPRSRLQQNAGWLLFYVGYRSADTEMFDGSYGHVMMLASSGRSASENAGVITPTDVSLLDNKFDDGAASTGIIRGTKDGTNGFVNTCVSGSNYNTAVTTQACAPMFLTGF